MFNDACSGNTSQAHTAVQDEQQMHIAERHQCAGNLPSTKVLLATSGCVLVMRMLYCTVRQDAAPYLDRADPKGQIHQRYRQQRGVADCSGEVLNPDVEEGYGLLLDGEPGCRRELLLANTWRAPMAQLQSYDSYTKCMQDCIITVVQHLSNSSCNSRQSFGKWCFEAA